MRVEMQVTDSWGYIADPGQFNVGDVVEGKSNRGTLFLIAKGSDRADIEQMVCLNTAKMLPRRLHSGLYRKVLVTVVERRE